LLSTLEQLVLHQDRFDYIIIETTGMANPGPIISSFWTDEGIGSAIRIDGVICVVDCLNIRTYLNSPDIEHEVTQQICYADRILLNKIDLVQEEAVQ
jgi:G3E family GTPase